MIRKHTLFQDFSSDAIAKRAQFHKLIRRKPRLLKIRDLISLDRNWLLNTSTIHILFFGNWLSWERLLYIIKHLGQDAISVEKPALKYFYSSLKIIERYQA